MPFLGAPILSPSGRGRHWVVKVPLVYRGRDETFRVPAGFITDLASVPQSMQWLIPSYHSTWTASAILHDYLCEEAHAGRFSRRDADGIFRRCLREGGVSVAQRWVMWAAVRVGGFMSEADRREWAQVSGIALAAVPLVMPTTLVVWLSQTVIKLCRWAMREGRRAWRS